MSESQWVLITLLSYMVLMIVIGVWATGRTSDQQDFFLGGRSLGPWVAALSASASSSSAWTLLGVSGAAYAWGLQAVWLMPGALLGYVFSWYWIAPRLRRLTDETGAVTLSEAVFGGYEVNGHNRVIQLASLIIIICFVFYVAAQFQAAGHAFASSFGLSPLTSIAIGAGIVMVYTLLGGFWAVSVTDTVQALLMSFVSILLPVTALVFVGGYGELFTQLAATAGAETLSLTGPYKGIMAFGFLLGTLSIGAGYHGQPHVANRFMALRDDKSLREGRLIAVGWASIVFAGMLTLGFAARVMFPDSDNSEQIFFVAARELFPPVIAGVMIAGVLSAIMSTADSQLLVAASSIARDWNLKSSKAHSQVLTSSRLVVVLIAASSCAMAMFAPETIFDRVLFAWTGIGSSFGPLVFLRVLGIRMPARTVLFALSLGFGLTVVFHWMPNTPGDVVERVVPFIIALATGYFGRERAA